MPERFQVAPFDRLTRVLSVAIVVLFAAVAGATRMWFPVVLSVLVLILSFAWSPLSYEVSDGVLRIRRLIGWVEIPLANLREARRTRPDDLRGCVRVMGSGGLFGYYGKFRTVAHGMMSWYVTNRANQVLIVTAEKRVLVSPADVDGFLRRIGTGTGEAASMDASPARRSRVLVWLQVAGLMLGLGAIVLGVLVSSYAPGAPKYTVSTQDLTIEDRLFPVTVKREQVDLGQARVVDLRVDGEWKPVERESGFANGKYRAGRFRLANGVTVHFYQADSPRLVLLPGKGGAQGILVQVDDPNKFLGDLRAAWGQD